MTALDRSSTPHDQDERCATHAHCLSCGLDEIDQPGDYRVCGECGHIFRTEQDLLDAERKVLLELARFFPPGRMREDGTRGHLSGLSVLSCPLCTHSF